MSITNTIIYAGVVAVAVAIGVYSGLQGESEQEYVERILLDRQATDRYMKDSPNSPIPEGVRAEFSGLIYYPPDRRYVIEARLTLLDEPTEIVIATSTGAEETYIEHSYAEFTWNGAPYRLLLLQDPSRSSGNRLFLAFTDRTSGDETYGGGRYLDVYPQTETEAILDFNRAYNPYCVYDVSFSCPLPPLENHLDFSVEAGEKMYPSGG